MNTKEWTDIPGRLRAAGFTIFYDRISYEPEHPLWCARASRDGREWSTLGSDLGAAFLELERQTQEPAVDWRAMIAKERSDAGAAGGRRTN
jgi:hypothetical protein